MAASAEYQQEQAIAQVDSSEEDTILKQHVTDTGAAASSRMQSGDAARLDVVMGDIRRTYDCARARSYESAANSTSAPGQVLQPATHATNTTQPRATAPMESPRPCKRRRHRLARCAQVDDDDSDQARRQELPSAPLADRAQTGHERLRSGKGVGTTARRSKSGSGTQVETQAGLTTLAHVERAFDAVRNCHNEQRLATAPDRIVDAVSEPARPLPDSASSGSHADHGATANAETDVGHTSAFGSSRWSCEIVPPPIQIGGFSGRISQAMHPHAQPVNCDERWFEMYKN